MIETISKEHIAKLEQTYEQLSHIEDSRARREISALIAEPEFEVRYESHLYFLDWGEHKSAPVM